MTLDTHEDTGQRSGVCAKSGADECAFIVDANDLHLLVAPRWTPWRVRQCVKAWVALKLHSAQASSSHRFKLLARQGDSGIDGERVAFREEVRQHSFVKCGAQALQITLAQITLDRVE
jgi:hypothetical protein